MTAYEVLDAVRPHGISAPPAAADQLQAQGTNAGDQFPAAELDRAAQYGDLKAVQEGGQLTRNLAITLGNIDATRRSRANPTPPTCATPATRRCCRAISAPRRP
jgi:hypothetical protein